MSPPDDRGPERGLSVTLVSASLDAQETDADALLDRYHSLTGWAEALVEAGAARVTVVQRFTRDAAVERRRVHYRFVHERERARHATSRGRRLVAAVAEAWPDVVHVNGLGFPLIVRRLRAHAPRSTRIVVQDHGGFGAGAAPFRSFAHRWLYRFGLRRADALLFTAREQAAPWREAGIIGDAPVHEILESSTDLAAAAAPVTPAALPGRPALLWVAGLDANKDPLAVLAGFERALAGVPGAALTMVYGEDPLLAAVRARVEASPALRPRVHLRGRLPRAELPALYAAADLFVIGSHHEVACFALLEALSFGVTPVVTNIPAFRNVTAAGAIGRLFPPGDAPALARAIVEAAAHPDPRARRASVRAHFERTLSWPALGREALLTYATIARAG